MRIVQMLGAYLAAILAANVALYISTWAAFFADIAGFIAVVTVTSPALLAIVYAEIAGVRSGWFYIVAGTLAGACAPYLLSPCIPSLLSGGKCLPGNPSVEAVVIITCLCAWPGLVGGLVYWVLAGRMAGERRNATGWRNAAYPFAACAVIVGLGIALRSWRERPLPPLLEGLPAESAAAASALKARLVAKFPLGSRAAGIARDLKTQGFTTRVGPSGAGEAELHRPSFLCERVWRVVWRADDGGRVTDLDAERRGYCL